VPADVLGLAPALAADHRNLREVDGGAAPLAAEDVLECRERRSVEKK